MIKPNALKFGDNIGIVAPAGPLVKDIFFSGVDQLKSLGFKTKFNKDIFAKKGYLAGHDQRRAEELNKMFLDPEIKAIICARGGYGSARLIPLIDKAGIKKNPKIFMGFSDITSLHLSINKECSLVTFQGPMVASDQLINLKELTRHSLLDTLTKPLPPPELYISRDTIVREGYGQGALVGGCLSILIHSLGTSYEVDTDNKILFLEDWREAPYSIDRMLTHLKLANKFDKVKGVLFGDMSFYPRRKDNKKYLKGLIEDIFKGYKFPICIDLPFGHGSENVVLPLGVKVTLDTSKGIMTFNEPAVI
ncbi:MAG: LD-carboxypeptidase [bacterium]